MPLYIRDDEVARLAEQVRSRLGVRTKTEAVRKVLEDYLGKTKAGAPVDRNARARALAGIVGPPLLTYEQMKPWRDEMWGEK